MNSINKGIFVLFGEEYLVLNSNIFPANILLAYDKVLNVSEEAKL